MSSETWNRAGHFAFLLHSLKIEASPKGDFGPIVDVCNGWDIMGYDSWGLLLTPQWVEVKEAAEYSNLARCQGAPYLVQEKYAVQVLVLSRWRHSAWDRCSHWQVCSQGSLDGTRITSQMVCTEVGMHSLHSWSSLPACRFAVEKYFSVLVRGT